LDQAALRASLDALQRAVRERVFLGQWRPVPAHRRRGRSNSISGADRILCYVAIVGHENIIAGADCGLGGRVHADLAWAKLRTLVEGARLASGSLWS
jgi:hypothetical protein